MAQRNATYLICMRWNGSFICKLTGRPLKSNSTKCCNRVRFNIHVRNFRAFLLRGFGMPSQRFLGRCTQRVPRPRIRAPSYVSLPLLNGRSRSGFFRDGVFPSSSSFEIRSFSIVSRAFFSKSGITLLSIVSPALSAIGLQAKTSKTEFT